MLWQEAEESAQDLLVCLSAEDIDQALAENKIAAIMGLEGSRPLHGKPNMDCVSSVRNLHKLGLRHIQLVDMGRNKLGDGTGTLRTDSRLTEFGLEVVQECNRLGMVVDVAHLNDRGFWDVIETSSDPIVDSHSCVRAISNFPRAVTDDRIKALAQNGGVLGLSCYDKHVNLAKVEAGERPNLDDFVKHIDHAADLVGIEHIGIGPDHFEDHGFSPAPGWMEGFYIGVRDHYHVEGLENVTEFPLLTEALVKHGYSDDDIRKVLGENLLRVYRQVLG
jgi:membrane dipeptidase